VPLTVRVKAPPPAELQAGEIEVRVSELLEAQRTPPLPQNVPHKTTISRICAEQAAGIPIKNFCNAFMFLTPPKRRSRSLENSDQPSYELSAAYCFGGTMRNTWPGSSGSVPRDVLWFDT